MPPLASILWLVLFYVLLLVEFFVPSAGIIGVAAAIVAVIAVATALMQSVSAGLTMFASIAATTPVVLFAMIHVWPKTAVGRRILNRQPGQLTRSTAPERTLPDGRPLAELEQRIGIAVTDLLPAGRIQMEGHRLDAISIGVAIDRGTRIIVTKIEAGKIQVRPALPHELDAADSVPGMASVSPDLLDVDLSDLEADDALG